MHEHDDHKPVRTLEALDMGLTKVENWVEDCKKERKEQQEFNVRYVLVAQTAHLPHANADFAAVIRKQERNPKEWERSSPSRESYQDELWFRPYDYWWRTVLVWPKQWKERRTY